MTRDRVKGKCRLRLAHGDTLEFRLELVKERYGIAEVVMRGTHVEVWTERDVVLGEFLVKEGEMP